MKPGKQTGNMASAASRSFGQNALGGMLWMFSSTAAQAVLQVLVLMVLARLLTPSAFGVIAAGLVVIRIADIVAELGVGNAVVQKPELDARDVAAAFTFFLVAGIVVCGLVEIAAAPLASLFRIQELTPVLRVLALAVPLATVSELAFSLLRRNLRFREVAIATVVSYLVGYGLLGISLAYFGFGVWSLVAGYLATIALKSAAVLMMQAHPKRLTTDLYALRQLLHFGGGVTAWGLANSVATQADNFVVGRWLGAEALGIYSRAYHLAVSPAILFGRGCGVVLFPIMAAVA